MIEGSRNIGSCVHLLFCSKNMERIGDHAANIAESVGYMVDGDRFVGDRPNAMTRVWKSHFRSRYGSSLGSLLNH
jgi:phosphate transport system protein